MHRVSFSSECEAFGVDVAAPDAGGANVPPGDLDHRRRPAHVDVAFGDVGDELLEMGRREQTFAARRRVIADDVVELESARACELVQLGAKDEIVI